MNRTASTGTMRFFSEDRNYGFIVPDDGGSDIFCPGAQVLVHDDQPLSRGDRVSFGVEIDHSNRARALNVRRLDEA
jgi:cold shock protein